MVGEVVRVLGMVRATSFAYSGTMFDYNTRLVTFSAGLLGCMAGAVGVYLLLRRRSLLGDTICHASLPGLGLSFLVQVLLGGNGRNLGALLVGAALSGIVGAIGVLLLGKFSRLKPDAILATILSVFFGLGMVLFGVVQQVPEGNAAGLENFILGKSASIVESDFQMLVVASMVVLSTLWLCRKELQVFCFDSNFASSTGWSVLLLDLILLTSVLVVVIVGANVVGVILVVALMVIPPVSARFWTSQLQRTVCISAFLGGMAGVLGSIASLYIDHMPTGPSIVLAAALLFSISLLFGKEKGLVWRAWSFSTLKNEADSEHVLRSIFEVLESLGQQPQPHGQTRSEGIAPSTLIRTRSWDGIRLKRAIDFICREGWAVRNSSGEIALTASGIQASLKSVRRHRLLELYFANLADLSPAALDRGADVLEHALDDEMLAKLEQDFISMGIKIDVPESVHPILSN